MKSHLEITKPRLISVDNETGNKATFTYGPLAPGYAITVGNSLRRILLSSIPGCNITYIHIEGYPHLCGTIEHFEEDIVELVEKFKLVCFKITSENINSKELVINVGEIMKQHKNPAKEQFTLTSKMIPTPDVLEILNDVPVCSINGPVNVKITLFIERGVGYLDPASVQNNNNLPHGYIPINSPLNAVRKVSMVNPPEKTIHGEFTNYELLKFDVETNGSITPAHAVHRAITTLAEIAESMSRSTIETKQNENNKTEGAETKDLSKRPITELTLREPILNILKNAGILEVGHLCALTKEEAMRIPKLGVTKVELIEQALASLGLTFSTHNSNYNWRHT